MIRSIQFQKSGLRAKIMLPLLSTGCLGGLVFAVVLLSGTNQLKAQSAYTWTGGGTDGNWGTGANWGGTAPASLAGYLNFSGATRLTNTNNYTAGSGGYQIYFKNTAGGAFNLYGNTISFYDYSGSDPNIQNEGTTYAPTINFAITNGNLNGTFRILNVNLNTSPAQGPLIFNGPISGGTDGQLRVINVYGGSAIAFNGIISDGPNSSKLGLTQLGSGTTTLSASNTFTGDLAVNAGTVVLATNNPLANNGNYIRLGDVSGTLGANLNLNGGNSLFTPINVRSGSSGGKIIANTAGTAGAATFGTNIYLDNSVTLYANTGGGNLLAGATLDLKAQTLTIDGPGSNYITGVLQNSSGSGSLVKNGSGTLTLSGANTYLGTTTINTGMVFVANGGSVAAGSSVKVNTGGFLTINSGGTVSGPIEVATNWISGSAVTTTTFTNAGTVTANLLIDGIPNTTNYLANTPPTGVPTSTNSAYAALMGGSSTSAGGFITNNGVLYFYGSTAMTLGTVVSTTGGAGIDDGNSSGKTITLASGDNLSYTRMKTVR